MDAERQAFAQALKLLARRDHSEAELAGKLKLRGISALTTAAVVVRLKEEGYLDDRRFARRWAECAVENGRGFGPRLTFELHRRGIDGEIVAEVLAEIENAHDEAELLLLLMAKKFPRFDPAGATDGEKRRVLHFLQRRGFGGAAIHKLFRDYQGR